MVGWAGETTLDVEYAHTIAPGANVLLVETPVSETEGVTGRPRRSSRTQCAADVARPDHCDPHAGLPLAR